MKQLIVFTLVVAMVFSLAPSVGAQAQPVLLPEYEALEGGNYSDEMKIPYAVDLGPDEGADSVERQGDHQDSPYFNRLDFYNMVSTDTLTILSGFETQQQTSEWNCGVSAVLMVANWYGKLGTFNEESLAVCRLNGLDYAATNLRSVLKMLEAVGGLSLYSTLDAGEKVHDIFTLDYVQKTLAEGKPIIIGWNDWGGHWQVIIGYDTMGTQTQQDDVIIVADSYDTTDHNQDGYGVYPAERFYYNFTFYDFFPEEDVNDMCFVVASPL